MTVQFHARPLVALAVVGVLAGALEAQPVRRPPRQDTPRLTVQVFRSADKIAGPAASDALRERLIQIYPGPVLWVIDKEDVVQLLEQSGYATNEQLQRSDESNLAKFIRADEYIRGSVVREADGQWRADAQLVLARDASLTQTLPPSRGSRPERAAVGLVRAIQDARRQLDNEKRCMEHARARRFPQAIAEADRAIAEYPAATLVRYCKMNALLQNGSPRAEVITVADEVLALDPNNRVALAIAADAHKAEGRVDQANDLYIRLLTNEPNNTNLAESVIEALAASRRFDVAKTVVTQAVQDNPGEVDLVRLQFLILAAAGDYKDAIRTGNEMIALDTAKADIPFFTRMISLYAADSQPAQAAEMAQRGTTKFPNSADLWQRQAQTQRAAGNVAGQVESLKRALALNPNLTGGWLLVAQAYNELSQQDSMMAALRGAISAGESADLIAGMITSIGNQRRVQGGNEKDLVKLRDGVRIMNWADTVSMLADSVGAEGARRLRVQATDETKQRVQFILGATAVTLFREAATAAGANRSCELAREAEQNLIAAQIALPKAARINGPLRQNAIDLLNNFGDFQAYATQQTTTFCR